MEWLLKTIKGKISKRKQKQGQQWWEIGKIDVEKYFYNPNWISFPETAASIKEEQKKARFNLFIAILGLIIAPFAFVALGITSKEKTQEKFKEKTQENKKLTRLKRINFSLGIAGILFWIVSWTLGAIMTGIAI